ncbi:MAG: beta-lactamase family protein [Chlorobi bacterium]|nr:beta-lactamase family protein [Chlorobiota bacterium]
MKNKFLSIVFLMISLFLCQVAFSQHEITVLPDSLRAELKNDFKSQKVQGFACAVFDTSKILWEFNYGFSDRELKKPVSFNENFLIGSTTKLFTAIGVMQLVERGLINLDAPLVKYIPEFYINSLYGSSDKITIRQIMTHHAGLPTDFLAPAYSVNPPYFSIILDKLKQMYTIGPAGKMFVYSNIDYQLLGLLIERVSGLSYQEYIKKNIFIPANMKNSFFYTNLADTLKFAASYDRHGHRRLEYPLFGIPAGSIASNVYDMINFSRALMKTNSPLIGKAILHEMCKVQNRDVLLDLDDRFGLCFFINYKNSKAGRIVEHGGAVAYQRSQLYLQPETGVGAILLSNSPNGVNDSYKIRDHLLLPIIEKKTANFAKVKEDVKRVNVTSIKDKNLNDFTGYYATAGYTFKIEWKDNNLFTRLYGRGFYIRPLNDTLFVLSPDLNTPLDQSLPNKWLLETIEGHQLIINIPPWGDMGIVAAKYTLPEINENIKEKYGEYEIINLKKGDLKTVRGARIYEADGQLLCSVYLADAFNFMPAGQPYVFALKVVDDNHFQTAGLGRYCGESLVFDPKSATPTFNLMGLELQKKMDQ